MFNRTRFISALVLLPITAFFIHWGGWLWFGILTAMTLVATWEFNRMMQGRGHRPHLWLGWSFALVALLSLQFQKADIFLPAVSLLFIVSLVWQLFDSQSEASVVDWALSVTGGAYIGLGMAHLIGLRQLPNGEAWVWLALFATWSCDSFAYLIGKSFGKRKFWPRVSPKKTWEGIFGGVLGGIFGGYVVAQFSSLPFAHAMIIGLLASVIAPLGDLSISMMKRYAGVKDASHIIPGHGGVLDRLDSVLFVVIIVFYYATWLVV